MNIVNICMGAPFTEGYSYQDSMLSDYQHRLGHDVSVITGVKTRNGNGEIVAVSECDTILSNGVRLIRIGPHGAGRLAHNVLGVYPGVKEKLEELKPSFVMVHGLGSHIAGYAVNYKKKYPNTHLIADSHQDYGITNMNNPILNAVAWYFKKRWQKWIIDYDKIYAVTSWRKAFAHDRYGIPYEKMETLILGIGEEYINLCRDKANREKIRKEFGIPTDCFVFCTGGKLDSKKKTIEMMRAFHRTKESNVRYLIFGSLADEIRDECEKMFKEDIRFVYVGYVPSSKTNNILAAADFGLFAGNHSVLWEQAIGCGLPSLFQKYEENDHTDVCGNCIRIKNAQEDEIYCVLKKILDDPVYYDELKRNAEMAAHDFSYRAIAEKSLEYMPRDGELSCRN